MKLALASTAKINAIAELCCKDLLVFLVTHQPKDQPVAVCQRAEIFIAKLSLRALHILIDISAESISFRPNQTAALSYADHQMHYRKVCSTYALQSRFTGYVHKQETRPVIHRYSSFALIFCLVQKLFSKKAKKHTLETISTHV